MSRDNSTDQRSTKVAHYVLILSLGWTCAIISSLAWNSFLFRQETRDIAQNVARNHIEEDILYRRWNAQHGGVYVPVGDGVERNENLAALPERDLETPLGRKLTLVSHGVMAGQAHAVSAQGRSHAFLSHAARLLAFEHDDDGSSDDRWANKALAAFKQGAEEVSEVVELAGRDYLRLVRPFVVEESCLKCHGDHKVGDIKGGISVMAPVDDFVGPALKKHITQLRWGHLVWWALGILGIGISYASMRMRIVERQLAEEALRAMQRRQEQILAAAGEGIFGVDRQGIISFANPAALAMLGWEHDELVGQDQHEVMHHTRADGSLNPKDSCPIFETLRDGKVHQGSELYWRQDGSSFPIEYVSTPIIENGIILGAVIIFTDITARRKAEKQMAMMRHYLQNVINSMPSVIVGVDPEVRITLWNNEAEKVVGLKFDKVRNRSLDSVMPAFSGYIEKIKMAMQEQYPLRLDRIASRDQAQVRYSDIIIYPVIFNEMVEAVIRIDDVTDRVFNEDRVIQTEKMMSVASLVEGMAHEINNPLGGIMQGVQSVRRRMSGELAKNREVADEIGIDLEKLKSYVEQRDIDKFLEGIRKSGKRTADIVSYMLQFSRDRTAVKENRNLAALIEHAVELASSDSKLRKKFAVDKITFRTELADNLPEVYCSVADIEQVLINLLKNAIQVLHGWQPEGGDDVKPTITLRLKKEETGNMALIEVEDNGPGIEEAIIRRIFEPFFTTKPPGEGIGLGLAVSYFIITVTHRGGLFVESAPGQGAKFIIKLPLTSMV